MLIILKAARPNLPKVFNKEPERRCSGVIPPVGAFKLTVTCAID